jgi:phosphoribosylamine--glycine ligase
LAPFLLLPLSAAANAVVSLAMRLLCICDAADGLLDLALRAQVSGNHRVRVFIRKYDARTRPVGRGLVELVADWRPHMDWADLVVLEGNGFSMKEFGAWRVRGVPIIGGDEHSAAWELDREEGMKVFRRAGIDVPEYRHFDDYETAIRYTERIGEPLYSKPCSDSADKSLSAKTGIGEDVSWQLREWKRKHTRPPCPFLLQHPVEGIEMGVAAWFGPGGFCRHAVEENFEHKKLHSGDVGPNTGEMGTVLRLVQRSRLFAQVLEPLEERLAAVGYVGNVSVNTLIDKTGKPWPLEFTMRLGWPSTNIELDLFNEDPVEFFHAIALGERMPASARRLDEAAVGVVLALPPYPYPPRDYQDLIGIPIYCNRSTGIGDIHPCEVMAGTETMFESAGHYVAVGVGCGERVSSAARQAYRTLEAISMPCSPLWRDDIGERLKTELPELHEHRFASGLEY